MNNSFNPYEEWLGIDHNVTSYYQLIGVREFEPDIEKIRLASLRAITRVRGYRPGQYAQQWAQLLDLLKRIQSELTDPASKLAYDRSLGADVSAQTDVGAKAGVASAAAASARAARDTTQPAADEGPDFEMDEPAALPAGNLDPMAPIDPGTLPEKSDPATRPTVAAQQRERKAKVRKAPPAALDFWIPPLPGRRRSNLPAMLVGAVCLIALLAVVAFLFKDRIGLFGNNSGNSQVTTGNQNAQSAQNNLPPVNTNPSAASNINPTATDPVIDADRTSDDDASASPNEGTTESDIEPTDVDASRPDEMVEPDSEVDPEPTDPEPTGETTTPETTTPETTTPEPTSTEPDPESTTDSSSTPEPEPEPIGEMASAEELAALSEALVAARAALQIQNFEVAEEQLAEAEEVAKSEEHQAMVARLRKASDYLKQFRAAVDRTMKTLEAGVSFQAGNVIVAVVERKRDAIIIKAGGRNRTYPLNELGLNIGLALADQGLGGVEDAALIKGVFQAFHPNSEAKHIDEVRTWWEKEGEKGAELLPLLDDKDKYESIGSPSEPNGTDKDAPKPTSEDQL